MKKLVLHTLGFLISETLAPIFKVEANRRTQKRCREKACRRKQTTWTHPAVNFEYWGKGVARLGLFGGISFFITCTGHPYQNNMGAAKLY
jgi:hypothetical protein